MDWKSYDKEIGGLLDSYNKLHYSIEVPFVMITMNRLKQLNPRFCKYSSLVLGGVFMAIHYGLTLREGNGVILNKENAEELGFPFEAYRRRIRAKRVGDRKSLPPIPKDFFIPQKEKEKKGDKGPFIIKIHETRVASTDCDGSSYKALIDALRYCGVIYDDDKKHVKYIFSKSVKDRSKEESTLISIWRK